MITQAQLHQYLLYDHNTGIFYWRFVEAANRKAKSGLVAGTYSKRDNIWTITIRGTKYSAHNLAWYYMKGVYPEAGSLKHKNGDRSDNRISNLWCMGKVTQIS